MNSMISLCSEFKYIMIQLYYKSTVFLYCESIQDVTNTNNLNTAAHKIEYTFTAFWIVHCTNRCSKI